MSDIKGLPPELISKLMSSGRAVNAYGPKLAEFVESDEPGIDPREQWSLEFSGKKTSTLYQGFMTAVKAAELQDVILVKQYDGGCYLLHKERAAVAASAK